MKIVMLAGRGKSTNYIYNGIKDSVDIEKVLVTDSLSKKKMIKGRIKRLGYFKVINQLLFQLIIVKILSFITKSRYESLKNKLNLSSEIIPKDNIIYTGKVNSKKTIEILQKINPDIVIVNGTSIISSKVLNSIKAIFINTHVGIIPQYRGVHGGYWALYNNDAENFGVTIHLVDKGIDTGGTLYQQTTIPEKKDNFITYPLYQYALALPLLKKAVSDIKRNEICPINRDGYVSKLYYHPTFTQYLYGLIFKSVK